jgi:hypothetical protein
MMMCLDELRNVPIGETIVVEPEIIAGCALWTVYLLRGRFWHGIWRRVHKSEQPHFGIIPIKGDQVRWFRFVGQQPNRKDGGS